MNRRLQQFLSAENISQSQFAESIGVARANVSHILSGRNKPGFDFIEKMLTAYPALNIDWLITGKGKMYRSSYSDNARNTSDNISYSYNNQAVSNNDVFSDESNLFNSDDSYIGQGDIFQSAMNYNSFPAHENNSRNAYANAKLADGEQDNEPASEPSADYAERPAIKRQNQRVSQRSRSGSNMPNIGINTFDSSLNYSNNQRVITKIIVYYSDNTFQELK